MDTPIVRLGENCYVELSKKVPTARDFAGGAAANKSMRTAFKCAFNIGSEGPRDDLFDHLKRKPAVIEAAPKQATEATAEAQEASR